VAWQPHPGTPVKKRRLAGSSSPPPLHVVRHFTRALRLRCPHCGGGPIFVTWSRLVPNCPVCGLGLERGEEGYWLGAYFFNLMAVETVFSVWMVGFLLWTWPSPPWELFQIATIVLMLVVPFAFFPLSKTLFLAFDLLVRPPGEEDFILPHEPAPAIRRGRQTPS
jgi:uncharacterized protein (DUF983 family)